MAKIPEACYSILPSERLPNKVIGDFKPIMVEGGSNSYRRVDYTWKNITYATAKKLIDDMNEKLGVSLAEADAMRTCSIFNCWDKFETWVENYSG